MTVHLSNPAHQQQWREQAPTRPEEHQVSTDETAAPSLEVRLNLSHISDFRVSTDAVYIYLIGCLARDLLLSTASPQSLYILK